TIEFSGVDSISCRTGSYQPANSSNSSRRQIIESTVLLPAILSSPTARPLPPAVPTMATELPLSRSLSVSGIPRRSLAVAHQPILPSPTGPIPNRLPRPYSSIAAGEIKDLDAQSVTPRHVT